MDPVVKHYEEQAAAYDRRWRAYIDATIGAVAASLHVADGDRLLDVPCGTGALEDWLAREHPGVRVVGADASPAMLARAKAKHGDRYEWVEADARRLPFADASFDQVVCANAFHCFDRPREVLAEFARVLKPRGRLLILDWCDDYLLCKVCSVWFGWFDPAYRSMFASAECRRLLAESGFAVRDERRFRHRVVWGLMLFDAVRDAAAASDDAGGLHPAPRRS
jgi:ubiquinone/menaquinone biosynthesis C-methylase UbiE